MATKEKSKTEASKEMRDPKSTKQEKSAAAKDLGSSKKKK